MFLFIMTTKGPDLWLTSYLIFLMEESSPLCHDLLF